MKKSSIIFIVIALLLVGGGIYFAVGGTKPADPSVSAEELIKLSAEDEAELANRLFVDPYDVTYDQMFPDVPRNVFPDSWPQYAEQRAQMSGFANPLSFPLLDVSKTTFDDTDRQNADIKVRNKLLRDPWFGDATAQMLWELPIGEKTGADYWPWLADILFIGNDNMPSTAYKVPNVTRRSDLNYQSRGDHTGLFYWTEYRASNGYYVVDENGNKIVDVTKEYRRYAIAMWTAIKAYTATAEGTLGYIESPTASKCWWLPANEPDFLRAEPDPYPAEKKIGYFYHPVSKSGVALTPFGWNGWDSRPEIVKGTPDPVKPTPTQPTQPTEPTKPTPTPGTGDDPTPTPTPTPTPQPTPTPTPKPDGQGGKDPADDPVNQGNAPVGGGDNVDNPVNEPPTSDPSINDMQDAGGGGDAGHDGHANEDHNGGHSDPSTVTSDASDRIPQGYTDNSNGEDKSSDPGANQPSFSDNNPTTIESTQQNESPNYAPDNTNQTTSLTDNTTGVTSQTGTDTSTTSQGSSGSSSGNSGSSGNTGGNTGGNTPSGTVTNPIPEPEVQEAIDEPPV